MGGLSESAAGEEWQERNKGNGDVFSRQWGGGRQAAGGGPQAAGHRRRAVDGGGEADDLCSLTNWTAADSAGKGEVVLVAAGASPSCSSCRP